MDQLERGTIELLLDLYLQDLDQMIGSYLEVSEFVNRPGELTQIGKLWLDGFITGLFLGIRSLHSDEKEVSQEDLDTLERMIENREREVANQLLR